MVETPTGCVVMQMSKKKMTSTAFSSVSKANCRDVNGSGAGHDHAVRFVRSPSGASTPSCTLYSGAVLTESTSRALWLSRLLTVDSASRTLCSPSEVTDSTSMTLWLSKRPPERADSCSRSISGGATKVGCNPRSFRPTCTWATVITMTSNSHSTIIAPHEVNVNNPGRKNAGKPEKAKMAASDAPAITVVQMIREVLARNDRRFDTAVKRQPTQQQAAS
mmetsp:Transcript_5788/g.18856  ORF Transcript_5788/g.18856 Transcript_5788/m.18856 type:complete len:220 (+) Transcript_5788:2495-3154(+)